MPLNKRQAPFELSLILLAVLFTSAPKPTLCVPPRLLPGAAWERDGKERDAGTRGWCILAAAGGNGAAYITPWLGNEVKLRQLFCRSFQRVWGLPAG